MCQGSQEGRTKVAHFEVHQSTVPNVRPHSGEHLLRDDRVPRLARHFISLSSAWYIHSWVWIENSPHHPDRRSIPEYGAYLWPIWRQLPAPHPRVRLLDRKMKKSPAWISGAVVLVALVGGLGYIGLRRSRT